MTPDIEMLAPEKIETPTSPPEMKSHMNQQGMCGSKTARKGYCRRPVLHGYDSCCQHMEKQMNTEGTSVLKIGVARSKKQKRRNALAGVLASRLNLPLRDVFAVLMSAEVRKVLEEDIPKSQCSRSQKPKELKLGTSLVVQPATS